MIIVKGRCTCIDRHGWLGSGLLAVERCREAGVTAGALGSARLGNVELGKAGYLIKMRDIWQGGGGRSWRSATKG